MIVSGHVEVGGAGRLSRRRLLSAAAAAIAAWAIDALSAGGAEAATTERVFVRSVINVKERGARGDGIHDDTRALRAAILGARDGDALYFPTGTYLVSGPLLPKPNQLFFSLTDGATVKAAPGKPALPIFIVRSGPVEFRRLTIDGSKDSTPRPAKPTAAPGILGLLGSGRTIVLSVSACRIKNVHSDGVSISGDDGSGSRLQRVMVRDTVVDNCGLNGLSFGRIDNIRVESCRFEQCNNGIKVHGCHNVLVQGVRARANRRHGIAFTFSHGWRVEHCVASGNGLGKDGGWGIAAGGEKTPDLDPNSDFTISDNVCMGNSKGGITLDPTMPATDGKLKVWVQNASVSGNVCRKSRLGHGIQVTHASNVLVTDNLCANNRASGIQLVDSGRIRVQRNTCFANHIGIGEFLDGCVDDPGRNLIRLNRRLSENDIPIFRKKTDEC